jgi:hypothetical protein
MRAIPAKANLPAWAPALQGLLGGTASRDFPPGPKGRGFSRAASRPWQLFSCLAARAVRQVTDCAGRETERGEKALLRRG